MMTQTIITINAIYRRGTLYPLTPLSLPEETPLSVDITLPDGQGVPASDFAALRGVWTGLGDPTYEEIEMITREAAETHERLLLSSLKDNTK
jgi:hypothetical protein